MYAQDVYHMDVWCDFSLSLSLSQSKITQIKFEEQ